MKKYIYCVYCGERNNIKNLKCKRCNKKLNPKENLFFDYLKEHIKDDLKGKTQDKIFSIIKNFIISHLYGSVFTATLIFTIVSSILINVNNDNIISVSKKPTILLENNNCNFENAKLQSYLCSDGFILNNGVCEKQEQVDARNSYSCINGYYLNNNKCISNESFSKLRKEECIAPSGDNVMGTTIQDGTCLVQYCSGWTDGECSAGYSDPIDFTITEYCPDGTTLINNVCKKITNLQTEYSCEEGILEGNKCIITKKEKPLLACEKGYIFNEECNICVGE